MYRGQIRVEIVIRQYRINVQRWSWSKNYYCVKSVRIWSFSGPYFPTFGPEKLRIQILFTQCSNRSGLNYWTKEFPRKFRSIFHVFELKLWWKGLQSKRKSVLLNGQEIKNVKYTNLRKLFLVWFFLAWK